MESIIRLWPFVNHFGNSLVGKRDANVLNKITILKQKAYSWGLHGAIMHCSGHHFRRSIPSSVSRERKCFFKMHVATCRFTKKRMCVSKIIYFLKSSTWLYLYNQCQVFVSKFIYLINQLNLAALMYSGPHFSSDTAKLNIVRRPPKKKGWTKGYHTWTLRHLFVTGWWGL